MAALNRQQVAAGILTATTVLGLCSCTPSPDPGPTSSGSPTVEQTMSPSPSPSPSAEASFNVRTAEESDWAVYADSYVSSDEPQGAGEQFIADTYPDLWDQGIRALSPKMVPGYNFADPAQPGALVQYIDGERFEGTISMPLGFRGQTTAPNELPSDAVANVITAINGRGARPAGNTGQGGYLISINERDPKGTALEVLSYIKNDQTKKLGSTMYFDGWEEAWAYAQSNGYSVPGMERALYPGEASRVTALHYNWGTTAMSRWVFDSSVNDWVEAHSFD